MPIHKLIVSKRKKPDKDTFSRKLNFGCRFIKLLLGCSIMIVAPAAIATKARMMKRLTKIFAS